MARSKKPDLGRILVVEDDAILATAIEAALMDHGAREVAVCPSLSCTMGELEKGRIDGIVLDVHLTDRDDGWALAELVSVLGTRKPRIVFSTGSPEDIPQDIAAMGIVMEKPYDPDDLAACFAKKPRGLLGALRRK
ncbi:response regulator [Paraurantiacibacter namhicola]|uniref:Two-component response regulator n=1 Tax=Paraurantiacibacter namhicola TaxID=645517 RepID=A0A1C7DBE5_9SPHN|nr:response regulator [Paraurantiacibacter namhicola]ANU08778.1 two-component response regulator [Paraurantiacibacter namhicola]